MERLSTDSRILLTGGHGFLGSYVKTLLISRGYTNLVVPAHWQVDLCQRHEVRSLMRYVQPHTVIHMAAVLGGIGAHENTQGTFLYDNLVMGLEVMEQARQQNVKKFVTIGTACAYPDSTPLPVLEEYLWDGFPTEITAPYGIAKRVLMLQGEYYRKQYEFNAISVIPANVYGAYDTFDLVKSHVIPALILRCLKAKKEGTPLIVWGTGYATREFIHAHDCARGIIAAVEQYNEIEPINLGSGIETPIREVVKIITVTLDFKGEVVWDNSKPDGNPGRVFDISRSQEKLHFKPVISLQDGIKSTIKWYLETQA